MSAVEARREGRLRDGMVIVASIRARLFGMKLLQLNADVTITPASARLRKAAAEPPRRALPAGRSNGAAGGDLAAAARALESTTGDLAVARSRMP